MKSLAGASGRLAPVTASRGLFGSSSDRPKVSQSKVLSGDDGPLFTLESELLARIGFLMFLLSTVNRIKPEYMNDYIDLS